MVRNRWKDEEARALSREIDRRVYTSRLLGQDAELVLHGGGNTSVKDTCPDLLGEPTRVLFIKGSGWDLATIEAPGLPAVRLDPLLRLRRLERLSDPDMVNELRAQLLDSRAPDPSVEALLHAFLPHKYVDHTHADAVLTLTNQPRGEELVREVYGKRVGIVPYVMPGFQLAKLCAEIYEKDPSVEGLVLLRHGIFSFGESAKQSYDRMISLVQAAEEYVLAKRRPAKRTGTVTIAKSDASNWMQAIRRELLGRGFPCVLRRLSTAEAIAFASDPEAVRYASRGPVTPDHVIRTKRLPLVVPSDVAASQGETALSRLIDDYAREYDRYFEEQCREKRVEREKLDPWPRVFLVPGVGVVTAGATAKAAAIALDIYEHTVSVVTAAEAMRGYEALGAGDIFDVEYWVLEQAKLKLGPKALPLSGKVALVTGAASGIGLATAKALAEQGACVIAVDRQEPSPDRAKELKAACRSGNVAKWALADVSNRDEMESAARSAVEETGGIDIVIVNAGVFPPSALIEAIKTEDWERSLRVNVTGAFHTLAVTLPWMKAQGAGGDVVFIASKNVPAPGSQAAAYSVAKAAQTQLARVAALEAGAAGIRVNTLHPHLVFDTGIWTEEVLQSRARAYGMTVEQYKRNNLLKTELSSRDVAKAAIALVSGAFGKTTGAQIPLDGGSDRTL